MRNAIYFCMAWMLRFGRNGPPKWTPRTVYPPLIGAIGSFLQSFDGLAQIDNSVVTTCSEDIVRMMQSSCTTWWIGFVEIKEQRCQDADLWHDPAQKILARPSTENIGTEKCWRGMAWKNNIELPCLRKRICSKNWDSPKTQISPSSHSHTYLT